MPRQNLALQSNAFDQGGTWVPQGGGVLTVSANAGTDPLGTTTADKMIPTAVNSNVHRLFQNFVTEVGKQYTITLRAKADGYPALVASIDAPGTASYVADLSTGTLATLPTAGWAEIRRVINSDGTFTSWYEIALTFVATSTTTTFRLWVFDTVAHAGTLTAFAGDAVSGVLLWRAQVEQSNATGEYVETTSAVVNIGAPTNKRLGQNYFLQSQNPTVTWIPNQCTPTANVATAPNGTATAGRLTDTAVNTIHYIRQATSGPATGKIYVASVYLKYENTPWFLISGNGADGTADIWFNIQTGAVGQAVAANIRGYGVINEGNGWYRVWVAFLGNANVATTYLFMAPSNGGSSYAGGTGTVLWWGAQFEQTDAPGDYQPTLTVAAT